jgi:DNA (cytosine-5)-methyltransferase 1
VITAGDESSSYNCVRSFQRITEETRIASMRAGLSSKCHKTFAEFFAGIGLMRMALERQGWTAAYANDIDPKKYQMYKAHFRDNDSRFQLKDIHNVQPEEIPNVALASASFPCNDLSLAGSRSGLNGAQSSAFWGFIRIMEGMGIHRPPIILLENVTGFLNSNNGRDFHQALLALNQLGYSVDAFILDAASFVPQSRPRLFVVGIKNVESLGYDGHDQVIAAATAVRPKRLTDFIARHSDIRWKVRDLQSPISLRTNLKDILEDIPDEAPEWWSTDRAEYLLNQMSPDHRRVADNMIARLEWSYGTIFRRTRNGKCFAELRTDGLAGCLRTPRGGSGRQILFKAGHGKHLVRLLTPRECARLMGADDYQIEVSTNKAFFGFGDAVCVPVIEWIAERYLNPVFDELISDQDVRPTRVSA